MTSATFEVETPTPVLLDTPQVCPVCGKHPKVIQTFSGDFFVLCFPHLETQTIETRRQAIDLWNARKFL